MTKKVLILSASVGAGHLRAAEAVDAAVRTLDPTAEVVNLDVLTLTNKLFRKLYGSTYLDLVNRAPHVLGYVYDMLDRPPSRRQKGDSTRRLIERINLRQFFEILNSQPWDVVINTHFLPAEMIAGLKRKQQFVAPQLTVTTDFETHRLWVNQPCEHYFTATDEGAEYLVHWGIPRETITVSGIPIHPRFSEQKNRDAILKKFGLAVDRPIVLQMAGGFGVGPIERIYRGILAIDTPLQLVAIAGRNEKVKAQLEQVAVPLQHSAQVIGFTKEIDDLMAVADLVVTKPGGLTTSETLASGAAMAIVNPIPGQEARNSDFLLERQAAIKINNLGTLGYKLGALLRDPQRLAQLKANARAIGRPRAAFTVAEKALNWQPVAPT